MNKKPLHEETLALVKRNPISKAKTCRETGLGLRWYFKFINNEFEHPSVHRVQILHDYILAKLREAESAAKKEKAAK